MLPRRTSTDMRSSRPSALLPALGMLAAAIVCVMSACNTTEGVGKDIKAAGNGIENAAEKAK